jgi:hypothetical protein
MTNTTQSFSAMLNQYTPNELFREELLKRDYLLGKVQKDNNWKNGTLIVPFEGASASSVKFGSLTASDDISQYNYQRGEVSSYKEAWGSLIFNHADLMQHGKVSEQSFLQILPGQVENFMQVIKEQVSQNMLGNSYFASLTADGDTGGAGLMTVDHPERFQIGMKFTLDDSGTSQVDLYVIAINMNTKVVTVSDSRGGSAFSISGYSTGESGRCYYDGVLVAGTVTNNFTSLTASLLSSANGGSASLYGKTKVTYPYLQAINVSGAAINATNILEKIFDAYTDIRKLARGNASTVIMSYKHLGSIMKLIETQKGAFKTTATSTKASLFGWTEIEVTTVKGNLTIVGIQEMDNSEILFLDWSALKFYSNGFFQKRKGPDGREYFEVRNTTGYQYIVDICLFGELVLLAPSKCGVIYGITDY